MTYCVLGICQQDLLWFFEAVVFIVGSFLLWLWRTRPKNLTRYIVPYKIDAFLRDIKFVKNANLHFLDDRPGEQDDLKLLVRLRTRSGDQRIFINLYESVSPDEDGRSFTGTVFDLLKWLEESWTGGADAKAYDAIKAYLFVD